MYGKNLLKNIVCRIIESLG